MAKNSFEEQYPDYKIIPEKKAQFRMFWTAAWVGFAILVIGLPLLTFKGLSYMVPNPSIAGVNKFTLPTVKALAISQMDQNKHSEAVASFERYFELGGQEADVMATYAYSLHELGREKEALTWARKAVATDPHSKAARLISEALEKKN